MPIKKLSSFSFAREQDDWNTAKATHVAIHTYNVCTHTISCTMSTTHTHVTTTHLHSCTRWVWHAATTHCNTLQHTATHCNALKVCAISTRIRTTTRTHRTAFGALRRGYGTALLLSYTHVAAAAVRAEAGTALLCAILLQWRGRTLRACMFEVCLYVFESCHRRSRDKTWVMSHFGYMDESCHAWAYFAHVFAWGMCLCVWVVSQEGRIWVMSHESCQTYGWILSRIGILCSHIYLRFVYMRARERQGMCCELWVMSDT